MSLNILYRSVRLCRRCPDRSVTCVYAGFLDLGVLPTALGMHTDTETLNNDASDVFYHRVYGSSKDQHVA